MSLSLVVTFVFVFVVVLLAVSFGTKLLETRRKQHVASILQTVSGSQPVAVTKLLRDLEPGGQTPLHRLMRSVNFAQTAGEHLQQAGLDWTPSRLLGLMGGAAAGGVMFGVLFPVLLSPLVSCLTFAGVCGSLPYLFVRRKRAKRMAAIEEQFPEALEFLARSMRAGHALNISLEMLGEELEDPLGQEFRSLFNEQNLGAPLDIALRNFTQRVPLLDAKFFCSSVLLQRQTGGNLAEILSRLSYVIRERFRLKGQVKAASAHGRMTATILTGLPIVTMLGLLLVAPGYLQGMAKDSDGRYLILGAVIAQVLGNICIKKIINIKV